MNLKRPLKEVNKSKVFLLLSFLPAIVFWWLEENYPLRIALAAGLGMAVIEIVLERFMMGHVQKISKFNFIILMFLGAMSLLGDEGIWFKLQPCFTGVGVGAFLFYQQYKGESLIAQMQKEFPQKVSIPMQLTKRVELHMSIFMFSYGVFMAGVAIKASTDYWLFFKTAGFYICSAVFFAAEVIYMRRWVRINGLGDQS